jgi:Zn-dependent protease/CBS domain-containing protein
MSWSFRLGRVLGIDVYVHFTFLLLLAFILVAEYLRTQSLAAALFELAFICLIFATVVLHEYGHALTARLFGVQTRDITLLPIGGIARLERIPEHPGQEFLIAVAGPAVNVVLAILCLAAIVATGQWGPTDALFANPLTGGLLPRLLLINVWLVIFNMIPAFPMDGGRVLRAVLAMRMNYVRATQIAATVGQAIAVLFGFVGLLVSPLLLLIAVVVWIGAAQEAQMVIARSGLAGLSAQAAMISNYRTVSPGDSLEHVAQHVLAGYQEDFPVLEAGRVVGILTRDGLLKALERHGSQALVADAMQRQFATANPAEPLNDVVARLQTSDNHSLPVIDHGRLVGIITPENVGELLMMRQAETHYRAGA